MEKHPAVAVHSWREKTWMKWGFKNISIERSANKEKEKKSIKYINWEWVEKEKNQIEITPDRTRKRK